MGHLLSVMSHLLVCEVSTDDGFFDAKEIGESVHGDELPQDWNIQLNLITQEVPRPQCQPIARLVPEVNHINSLDGSTLKENLTTGCCHDAILFEFALVEFEMRRRVPVDVNTLFGVADDLLDVVYRADELLCIVE